MSDDLKNEAVRHLRHYAGGRTIMRASVEAVHAREIANRLEAAEIREPSRLERVLAALPEGWGACHAKYASGDIDIHSNPHQLIRSWLYRLNSPLSPEEAVECAKKLAGVE